MKKARLFSALVLAVVLPMTLYFGSRMEGQWYYLTCTLMVIELMLPFFLSFEARKPQARELVILAVMTALAAISRSAFAFLPHFKPITAIIMITGIAFGAESGFLTGALAAFASNFFFGQGPWTPWQMLSYGFGGFLAGLVFHRRHFLRIDFWKSLLLAAFGFLTILLFVGPILDLCSVFTMATSLSRKMVVTVLAAGFPVNLLHAASCAATLFLFAKPLLEKLNRLQVKYGMME